jgi:putative spermidine/putrescine transport system substrate-binding protein
VTSRFFTRRRFLATTGAAGGALWAHGPEALAQTMACSQVVVGTWGGDYQDLLGSNFEKPILGAKKLEVVHDVANAPPRKTKLLAERNSRRGSMDVACLSDVDMYEMSQAGVLSDIDVGKLKNAAHIIKPLSKKYSIPHIYSGKVIVYNPNKVKPAPQSFNDLWDPKYKGRVGLADGLYIQHIETAALIAGGNTGNFEPGKAKLLELKKLDAKVYPSNEALAAALKSEEVWITLMWRARGFMWKKAGIPVENATPIEGATPIVFEAAVPKNAQNADCAYAYLDAMLDAGAQVGFADKMGYVPTVTNAKLSPDVAKEIAFSEAEQVKFNIPNYDYLAKNNAQLLDWWTRVFKA